jgi:hypothetical protein
MKYWGRNASPGGHSVRSSDGFIGNRDKPMPNGLSLFPMNAGISALLLYPLTLLAALAPGAHTTPPSPSDAAAPCFYVAPSPSRPILFSCPTSPCLS